MSNLKQLGHVLQMYSDDNEDRLPGPLWNGIQASFDGNISEEMLYYVYPYLGVPAPSDDPTIVPVAACPGFMHNAPGISSLADMEGRICYLLNPNVNPLPNTSALLATPIPRNNRSRWFNLANTGLRRNCSPSRTWINAM